MRLRRRIALGVVAVLGVATAALPALAGSETVPAVEAVNLAGGIYGEEHHWSPAQVAVAVGGSVALSNPTEVNHGVYWIGGPSKPSCTAGIPVGSSASASGVKWSGTCTFSTAGLYTFYCTVHGAAMTARVTVGEAATTPTTTTTPTTPATTTSGAPPSGGGGAPLTTPTSASPLSGPPSKVVHIAPGAHHGTVKGSVGVSGAGAGARLEVDLLLRRGSRLVRVGHLVRSQLRAGSVSFALALNATAARTLRSKHRLALTVRLVLEPLHGSAVRVSRSLVLRR